MFKKLIVLTLYLFFHGIDSKVLIFTYAYNKPYFIKLQKRSFDKFLDDEYEFVVFNDARLADMESQINDMCKELGLKCVRIPQEIHDRPYLRRFYEGYHEPHVRNVNVVQYSLNEMGFKHDDIVAIFDSDLFLVKKFSIRKFMEGYDLAGLETFRNFPLEYATGYLWVGIAFMNMATMPNKTSIDFNCGIIENHKVDAGGHTYLYLKNNPSARVRWFNYVGIHGPSEARNFPTISVVCDSCKRLNNFSCKHNYEILKRMGFEEPDIRFIQDEPEEIEFLQDFTFFHYKHGSNWQGASKAFHENKSRIVQKYMDSILH